MYSPWSSVYMNVGCLLIGTVLTLEVCFKYYTITVTEGTLRDAICE